MDIVKFELSWAREALGRCPTPVTYGLHAKQHTHMQKWWGNQQTDTHKFKFLDRVRPLEDASRL